MPHLAKEGESKGGKLAIQLDPDSTAHVKGVIEVESSASKQPAFYSVDLEVPTVQTGKSPDKPTK